VLHTSRKRRKLVLLGVGIGVLLITLLTALPGLIGSSASANTDTNAAREAIFNKYSSRAQQVPATIAKTQKVEATSQRAARAKGQTSPAATTGPEVVQIGTFVNQILSVDLPDYTFMADFYIWFKWKGNIDPTLTFDYVNGVNEWGQKSKPSYEEPVVTLDGFKYQGFHVQGSFVQDLDFHKYPDADYELQIAVEDSKYDSSELVYAISDGTGISPSLQQVLAGWTVENPTAKVTTASYSTNYGFPGAATPTQNSLATFSVDIVRREGARLIKAIIPIAIIMAITLLCFALFAEQIDARLALTITALISAVLLHDDATSELPPLGYFVTMDKIYLLSYAVIFLTLFESVLVFRMNAAGKETQAKRIDKIAAISLAALFTAGVIVFGFL